MLTKLDVLEKLKEIKPEFYKNYSVKEIGLFGSFSNNSNTENSDIDLLVRDLLLKILK